MEESPYNRLVVEVPEGSDWDGAQHRKTEFDSPRGKLRHDADWLIALAQHESRMQGIAVDPMNMIRRADDDVPVLQREIAIQLKNSPRYRDFVDGLELPDEMKEKLKAMLTLREYQLSLAAYYESARGSEKVPPTRSRIMEEIMKMSVDQLRNICEQCEKPTLLIVSDGSFDEGIEAMNANKHYRNANGGQEDTYVNRGGESPYIGAPKPEKGCVMITDGIPNPKQREGQPVQLEAGRGYLTREFEAASMTHISATGMQVLLQRSLIEATQAEDMRLVVDNWEGGDGTATFLDPESLTKSWLVAFSYFSSYARRAYFIAYRPGYEGGNLRGRPSAQVMEF